MTRRMQTQLIAQVRSTLPFIAAIEGEDTAAVTRRALTNYERRPSALNLSRLLAVGMR